MSIEAQHSVNDDPYPNHNFVAVIRERDIRNLDGECISALGYVSLYKGKPQIEAESRYQVSHCP